MRATESGNPGEEHLIAECEAEEFLNAMLRDVTTLCGEELDYAGTYKISEAYNHTHSLREYLDERADNLCEGCLREAVDAHGWPVNAEVLKKVVDA